MLSDGRFLHLAIVDIAFAVGFGDVPHFNRVFRRRFGETPVRGTGYGDQGGAK
jgi:AraC-like DNA-binding protein